uniref:Nerve growth factor receptor a (TNFR superfamily, member 16) n=1 Tax=Oryzias sinensis TaxID=183150 RepID=A0A8C7Z7J6_9TELE
AAVVHWKFTSELWLIFNMSSILRKMLKAKKHRSWSIDFLQCVIFSLTPALLILFSAGETFSESYSLTEKCMPCTQCVGLMRMVAPCTDISDAKCQCDYNFYFNPLSDRCERCTVCPRGQGVYSQCDHDQDTVCEDCVDETYSDQDSSVEPCLPCTICEEDLETLESEFTSTPVQVTFAGIFNRFNMTVTDLVLKEIIHPFHSKIEKISSATNSKFI